MILEDIQSFQHAEASSAITSIPNVSNPHISPKTNVLRCESEDTRPQGPPLDAVYEYYPGLPFKNYHLHRQDTLGFSSHNLFTIICCLVQG